jgi:hypothetical protein
MGSAAGGLLTGPFLPAHLLGGGASGRIRWQRWSPAALFESVACDGETLLASGDVGLLDGWCQLIGEADSLTMRLTCNRASAQYGPLQVQLEHQLLNSGLGQGEDLLRARLIVHNRSDRPQQVELTLVSAVQPVPSTTRQELYLPLSSAGFDRDKRFSPLGSQEFLKDCRQSLERDELLCHYLEPQASYPDQRTTKALLLAPVVDIGQSPCPWRVALFTESDQAVQFRSVISKAERRVWQAGRIVTVGPRQSTELSCWLLVHRFDTSAAWQAFHRHAHHEPFAPIEWTRSFKVHYYDFLSSATGRDGHRGDGYDADLPHFRDFHVGLATQHGYYASLGDYLHPDRKIWQAMQGDKQGPVPMSIETLKNRITATRATGAKAAVYMHLTLLNDASEPFPRLERGRRFGSDGQPIRFPWNGPDVQGSCWWMSIAAPEWREHLLQQARWIMEILQPDAICIDETFAGIGYDEFPERAGPLSPHAIQFFQQMRALVRSFGEDRAFFTSDCSKTGFSLWADGDVGDHAYANSLGDPLYRQEPVRYLAALGDKPWRPCAWHFRQMWKHQMALARQVGAGVGVSNGWLEYTGLHGLSQKERIDIIRDIESLL